MAKATVTITLEIEFDELQYEDDGFLGSEDVAKVFSEGHEIGCECMAADGFEYTIKNSCVEVSPIEPSIKL